MQRLWGEHVNDALLRNFRWLGTHGLDVARARGARLELRSGGEVLDFSSSFGATSLGYAHPAVLHAVDEFRRRGEPDCVKLAPSRWQAALAHNLATLLPAPLDTCFFTTSGAEAVEAALKLAFRLRGGGPADVICASGSFHGKTAGALAVTTAGRFRDGFLLGIDPRHVVEVPFGDAEALARAFEARSSPAGGRSTVAAVIVEPIQGQGVRVAEPAYLAQVVRLARRLGALSIFDEVKTGCGRTGSFAAFEGCGEVPDAVALAKGLGGGRHALGAMVTSRELFRRAYGRGRDAALHTTTFGGLGEACCVGVAVTAWLSRPESTSAIQGATELLDLALREIARRHPRRVVEILGRGLLRGVRLAWGGASRARSGGWSRGWRSTFETACTVALVRELLLRERVLTHFCDSDPDVLHVMPPLVVGAEEIRAFAAALDRALAPATWTRLMHLALRR